MSLIPSLSVSLETNSLTGVATIEVQETKTITETVFAVRLCAADYKVLKWLIWGFAYSAETGEKIAVTNKIRAIEYLKEKCKIDVATAKSIVDAIQDSMDKAEE